MNDSERLAVAAHLHVALRRKTGRVTDTEWMASDQAYAQAMVAFAMQHAKAHDDAELAQLAQRFSASLPGAVVIHPGIAGAVTEPAPRPMGLVQSARRYVGGLR